MTTLNEQFKEMMTEYKIYKGSQEEFDNDDLNIISMMTAKAKKGFSKAELKSINKFGGEVVNYGQWIRRHRERLIAQGIEISETEPKLTDWGVYFITLSWGK